MKKNIVSAAILLIAAVMAASCSKELLLDDLPAGNGTFTGVIEQFGTTRTALNSSNSVEWESTDVVRINDGFFSVAPDGTDATKAIFTFNGSGTKPKSGTYNAYYPSTLYDGAKLTLPQMQTYSEGKITNSPMYATSETLGLSFHNLCGLVEFTFKGTATISKIVVTADSGGLSGDFTVIDNMAVLTSDAKTANKGVTLDCGTGVALNNDSGVKFWIAIPAGTYKLTFTAIDTDGKVFQQITKAGVTVAANNIYAFNQTPTFTGSGYLCFTAAEAGAAVTLCKQGNPDTNALEYMTLIGGSSSSWTDLAIGTALPTLTAVGDKVYIRAKEARTSNQDLSNHVYFSIDKQVEASGNMMYLLDPTGADANISTSYWFVHLFKNCANLKTAEQLVLPATTLVEYCYSYMFYGCTGLTKAPSLPATTLAPYCYESMFKGCTGLTEAPALSAQTLAPYCYTTMFQDCTHLTKAPSLQTMTLENNCYMGMFKGCTSLEEAPALPSTTLAEACYMNMFEGCTGLAKAPALPAESMEANCYENMFKGCTSLEKAPALPATTLAERCYVNMFNDCTGLTDAPALPAMTLESYCYQGMFKGCTSLEKAPALPATTLADYCYQGMFKECTSLVTAPALPATTLKNNCYQDMFYYCSKLTSITCHATDISAEFCTDNWVYGVSPTGLIKVAKGMKTIWQDITSAGSGIPSGWFVEEWIPFSVSAEKQVLFSKGNLWSCATASELTWSFEEHQYDYPTENFVDFTHNAHFYWEGAEKYGSGASGGDNGSASDVVDWGVPYCNTNGLLAGTWRTPTKDEWQYLLYTRSASTVGGTTNARYATVKVTVNEDKEVRGMLIFPDEFSWTESMGALPGNCNTTGTPWGDANTYTLSQFSELESAGCVFLPTTSYRSGNHINLRNLILIGFYWSSTASSINQAYQLYFDGTSTNNTVVVRYNNRDFTGCVRLVSDIQ